MKKFLAFLCAVMLVLGMVGSASAFSINDSPNDAIGSGFESYGIDVYNFTPGINSGVIAFDLYTDYPEAGITVGTWATEVADLFITENYYGVDYLWAIPLVDHDTFLAGYWYTVETVSISDDFEPIDGYTYDYNHNAPVRIKTAVGTPYAGTATWTDSLGDHPDYTIRLQSILYEDDPDATFDLYWGTATCGNDPVEGTAPVPEPSTILLMGIGLLGLVGYSRKRSKKS